MTKPYKSQSFYVLSGLLLVLIPVSLFMIFQWVPPIKASNPTEATAQRIFYYHVASAWIGFFAFFMVFLGSVLYLWQKERRWENMAVASAEIGTLFMTIVLVTGPIWAKPTWGIWWTWDARLTSSLVLWLIYVAYLFLRRYLPDGTRRANLSAVVGIIGFIDVPLVWFSIRWWETQHPSAVVAGGDGSLAPEMLKTLLFCVGIFTILYLLLMQRRLQIARLEDSINRHYKEWETLS